MIAFVMGCQEQLAIYRAVKGKCVGFHRQGVKKDERTGKASPLFLNVIVV